MAFLENILVSDLLYDIAAKFDNKGNVITDTYATKTSLDLAKDTISSALSTVDQLLQLIETIDGSSEVEGSFRKAIKDLIGGAPEAYDTLKEIADKLATDDSLHSAILGAIAEKANSSDLTAAVSRISALESLTTELNSSKTVSVDISLGEYSTVYSVKQGSAEVQSIEVNNAPKVSSNILYL